MAVASPLGPRSRAFTSHGDVSYVRDVFDVPGASFVESSFPDLDLWPSPAGRWVDMALADAPRPRSRGRDRRA